MLYFYFYIFLNFLRFGENVLARDEGWHAMNAHCRDDDNNPVEWYIYKPADSRGPFENSGRQFWYINPDSPGRWTLSRYLITRNNMLLYTLSPLFRSTFVDHVAYIVFDARHKTDTSGGSLTRSILIADELSGLVISHTVPRLIDVNSDRPYFPASELSNGHMLACMSLDIAPMNELALTLRASGARITAMQIPVTLRKALKSWVEIFEETDQGPKPLSSSVEFKSSDESFRARLSVRKPGQKGCLYLSFAKKKSVILDVYAPSDSKKVDLCAATYGVRNIHSISLKQPESVQYINNSTDRSRFAVTTAAHWQKLGLEEGVYWSCLGNLEKDDTTGFGGYLLCVENYQIWSSFDNLKVKEPHC